MFHIFHFAFSTSGLKSDVTVVFRGPVFFVGRRIFSDSHTYYACIFMTSSLKKVFFWDGSKCGMVVRCLHPTNSFFTFGFFTSVPILV